MSAAIWGEPPEPESPVVEAHPNLGPASIRADHLPAIGRPPRSSAQGTGVLSFRVYGVSRETGVKYAMPPDVTPIPGQCIVPGCNCGGPTMR